MLAKGKQKCVWDNCGWGVGGVHTAKEKRRLEICRKAVKKKREEKSRARTKEEEERLGFLQTLPPPPHIFTPCSSPSLPPEFDSNSGVSALPPGTAC